MSLDYVKLVTGGRAHSPGKPWNDEELDALIKISQALNLSFPEVAPAIRDGVRTVEEFKTHIATTEVKVLDGQAVVVEKPQVTETKKQGRKTKKNE